MGNLERFWIAFQSEFITEMKIGDIGEGIRHAIIPRSLFEFSLGSFNMVLTDAVAVTWLAMSVMILIGWWLGHKIQPTPLTKRQQLAESFVDLLLSLCRSAHMTNEQADQVVPFIGSIGIFILLSNLVSLFKIPPPAKNPAFPIALAIMTVVYVIYQSIRLIGIKGFWASLIYPKAMLLPFKILDYFIKPLSLSLRLFGNVFGAFILMEFIYIIIPFLIPGIAGLWFDLADGLLQAVIFTYLTATYIGEVLENAHMAKEDKIARKIQPA